MTNHTLSAAWRLLLFGLIIGSLCALLPPGLSAQTTGTGVVAGRVYNPGTKEYVRDAEVRIAGTELSTFTAADGTFEIPNVPAGQVVVTVSYTGYQTATSTVAVTPGQVVRQDVSLFSTSGKGASDVVQLDAFTVSSQVEGNAKAIQQQKASMTVSKVVASDTFGAVAEGNVAEFLQYLPGITMDYVEADARNPRIRGLPAQYTDVTFNGLKIASADAFIQANGTNNSGGAGKGDRSFGFDVVSMSSIGGVTVNYTENASQDADGAAGNIDMFSKHAYERSDSALILDASGFVNSEELRSSKIARPFSKENYLVLPNGNFDYSTSLFGGKLGIVAGFSESNSFNEQRQFAPSYDTTPTAADPRPYVITKLQFKDGPKFSERTTGSLSLDFKATDQLSFGLVGTINYYNAGIANRTFAIATSSRANVPGDGITSWANVPISAVTQTMQGLNKRTYGFTYMPTFEYKLERLDITGAAAWSKSTNNYNGNQSAAWPGNSTAGVTISPTGMTATATRPADDQFAWTIRQTGGLDWGDLNNYKASATGFPAFTVDGRYVQNILYEGRSDVKYTTPWSLPTWLQFGIKSFENTFDFRNVGAAQTWNYIGPGGGNLGSWGMFPGATVFDPAHGASITSISGRPFAVTDQYAIGQVFRDHPEWFVNGATAANYKTAYIDNSRYVREQIDAGYAMFDTKPFHGFELQGGVRVERTRDAVKNFDPIPAAQVQAAGYTTTTGIANTIPGVIYQYLSRPRVETSTALTDLYPSAALKYTITHNLIALLGYSYTVTRPSFNDVSGAINLDDSAQTITIPNPLLKPEYSNNYTLALTRYFEPVGEIGVSVFENDFKNYTQSVTAPAATALAVLDAQGLDPAVYGSYTVTTTQNLPGTVTYRGLSLDYSQSLSKLAGPLGGLSIFANYTRLYYTLELPNAATTLHAAAPYNYGWLPGITPNIVNYGVTYKIGKFQIRCNARWTDATPTTTTYSTFMKQNTKLNMDASFRVNRRLKIYAYARNLLDVPDYVYTGFDAQHIGTGNAIEYYGSYLYGGAELSF